MKLTNLNEHMNLIIRAILKNNMLFMKTASYENGKFITQHMEFYIVETLMSKTTTLVALDIVDDLDYRHTHVHVYTCITCMYMYAHGNSTGHLAGTPSEDAVRYMYMSVEKRYFSEFSKVLEIRRNSTKMRTKTTCVCRLSAKVYRTPTDL